MNEEIKEGRNEEKVLIKEGEKERERMKKIKKE